MNRIHWTFVATVLLAEIVLILAAHCTDSFTVIHLCHNVTGDRVGCVVNGLYSTRRLVDYGLGERLETETSWNFTRKFILNPQHSLPTTTTISATSSSP